MTAANTNHRVEPWPQKGVSISRVLGTTVAISCFVYLLLRPVSNNAVLIPVLFTMGFVAVVTCVVGRRRLAPGFGPVLIFQAAFGLLGTAVGALSSAPGLIYGVLVYLAAPILYWTCVWGMDFVTVRLAMRWLAIGTSVLSTVIVLFVAGEKGLVPRVIPSEILDASGAALGSTFYATTEIRFYGLSTLAAAGPLWVVSLFVRGDRLMPSAALRIYAAASAIGAAFLAGRRAILVATLLAPLVLWLLAKIIRSPSSDRRLAKVGAPLLVAALLLGAGFAVAPSLFSFSAVSGSFSDAQALLLGSTQGGAFQQDIRLLESQALVDGWRASPIVGHGFGATLRTFYRDPLRPWNFELQYHEILFQAGIVGGLLCLLALLGVVKQLRAAARIAPDLRGSLLVTTTGAVSLLLANSVDPYLQAPGHMWAVYLPIAVANVMLMTKHTRANVLQHPFVRNQRSSTGIAVTAAAD